MTLELLDHRAWIARERAVEPDQIGVAVGEHRARGREPEEQGGAAGERFEVAAELVG